MNSIKKETGGKLHGLFNNAGVGLGGVLEVTPIDEIRKLMEVNVIGLLSVTRACIPMLRNNKGRIVNIGSTSSLLAFPGASAYCASKFAMTALGTAVGLEERENNIHITNVYPGEVNTPILAERPVPPPPEKLAKMLLPEDIASMVVALTKLHPRALVNELVITPLYQGYA